MSKICPPYINKHLDKIEKQVVDAEKKVLKAQKDLEFATEYLALCKKRLEDAKADK